MTYIEIGDMTSAELRSAIERHMAEAQMHMETAHALLEVATERVLDVGLEAKPGDWVQ